MKGKRFNYLFNGAVKKLANIKITNEVDRENKEFLTKGYKAINRYYRGN